MTFFQKARLFLSPLRDNKLLTFFAMIKFSGYAVYAIATVLIIKWAMHAISLGDSNLYLQYVWVFMGFFAWYLCIAWIFRTSDWPDLYHNIERWIYRRYIPIIVNLDNNYLEKIGTGRMISIFRDGRKVWIDQLCFLNKEFSKILVTGVFLFYMLFQIDWKYAVGLVFWLIVMHMIVVWIDMTAHRYRRVRTSENTEITRKSVRILMAKNEILQNNTMQYELDWILQSISLVAELNNNINRSLYMIFNLVRVFAVMIRFAILMIVWYGVFSHAFSLIDFVTIMAMIIVFENFLFDSTEFYKNFTKDFSEIEKLWETLDDAPQMQWYDTGTVFSPKKQDIIIDSISYGYNETRVFENFSLTLRKWQKIALVGASGGWKTTLMKLIAGYLHPDSGNISVLGNRLDQTALKTYYPHIGYLTQDPSVFDATIRENLISAVSEKEITEIELDKKLAHALKLAHCDFVWDLEKWLDTEIGERGVRLSGGQKQRLAIAKIFLKDPEIVLLDEPTSALDSFSEEAITGALDTLFENRTVIIVAHRLQTVRKADDIIVLEGWQVKERWTHESLIWEKWVYAKMLELQSGF